MSLLGKLRKLGISSDGTNIKITGGQKQSVVVVPDAATYTMLEKNSGKVHIMPDLAADCTITPPTPEDGLYYKFIVGAAEDAAHDWVFDTGSDTNYFSGALACIDDDDSAISFVASDGDSNSIMSVLTPGAGTVVEMWSNGTIWYVSGQVIGGTATSVTFADQS